MTSKKIGDIGEVLAIEYLQRHSYRILDTNFKFGRFGEVDIIAQKESMTVFLEVKYRSSSLFGSPEESITPQKLYKCRKTVEYYSKKNNINFEQIRFDVIAIVKSDHKYRITHYKNIEIGT